MARANFVKKARKNIYLHGKQVTYEGTPGTKREGKQMTRIDHTLPRDSKDPIIVPVGQSYWYWQFRVGPVHYSLTRPARGSLTQSEFLSWLYDFEDITVQGLAGPSPDELLNYGPDDLKAIRDEWVSEIEEHRDELEEKLGNMPESLQESSSSGQTLQERIDGLQSWVDELEGLDLDWDDEDLRQEAADEWELQHPPALQEEDPTVLEGKESWCQGKFLELKQDKIEELISELQSVSSGLG